MDELNLKLRKVLIGPFVDERISGKDVVDRDYAFERLCLIDITNMRAIDVETNTHYDVVTVVNGMILLGDISIKPNNRYAFVHSICLQENSLSADPAIDTLSKKIQKKIFDTIFLIATDKTEDGNIAFSNEEFKRLNQISPNKVKRR